MASPAEQLKARHAANPDHVHNPTVEEVPDEDDIQHPPPAHVDPYPPEVTMSDVARGKQKASAAPTRPAASFNLNSEDAFPSLGLGKAPPASAPKQWRRTDNGATGEDPNPTYGAPPTEDDSIAAPTNGASLKSVNLPGRVVERVSLLPVEITKRSELKKPIPEVLRDLNKKSKAQIVMKPGVGGNVVFEATGPQEAVRQALKDLVATVGSKVRIFDMYHLDLANR
jgi:hypothetical protein